MDACMLLCMRPSLEFGPNRLALHRRSPIIAKPPSMAYNFASSGYSALIRPTPGIDTNALRAEVVRRIEAFDPRAWLACMCGGQPPRGPIQTVEHRDGGGERPIVWAAPMLCEDAIS